MAAADAQRGIDEGAPCLLAAEGRTAQGHAGAAGRAGACLLYTSTLTCKSYTGYLQALQTAVDEVTADPDALAALSNDEINQKIGEIVIGSLDGVELAATQPITITYTKVDGTWEPASSTSGDIAAALMTN